MSDVKKKRSPTKRPTVVMVTDAKSTASLTSSSSSSAGDKRQKKQKEYSATKVAGKDQTAGRCLKGQVSPRTEMRAYNLKTPSTRKLIAKTLQGGNSANTILRPPVPESSSSGTPLM